MSALLKIGTNNTDLTSFITVPSYVVNSKDIYEEYSDGNKKFRRKLIRKRITGSFSLQFSDPEDYDAFVALIKSSRDNVGLIDAKVYVNNLDEVKTSKFYLEYELPLLRPVLGIKSTELIDVTIEEY